MFFYIEKKVVVSNQDIMTTQDMAIFCLCEGFKLSLKSENGYSKNKLLLTFLRKKNWG